jgi:hypothetical protein
MAMHLGCCVSSEEQSLRITDLGRQVERAPYTSVEVIPHSSTLFLSLSLIAVPYVLL